MEYDKFCDSLLYRYGKIFTDIPYIECDSGWYSIIEDLSSELNEAAKQYAHGSITVVQIKEKFGGLRYYVNYIDGLPQEDIFEIEQIICKYENLSHKTCQRCGEQGEICARTAYWVSTLCKKCAKELKEG